MQHQYLTIQLWRLITYFNPIRIPLFSTPRYAMGFIPSPITINDVNVVYNYYIYTNKL